MSMAQSRDDLLRELPEWRNASWTELAGGLTNRAWLLEENGRKAVLKFDDTPRAEPFNTRQEEAAVQALAAKAGLANPVLFANHRVYLTEFVEGTAWNPVGLDQEGKIEQLAATLRRLHSLPRCGRSFNAPAAAKMYLGSINYPDTTITTLCVDVIRKTRLPNYLCFCHNDLVAENMITTPELKFLDWEYACDNDPMFDLATVAEHHELSDTVTERLLDAYFDGDGGRWHEKLGEQRRLYLALYWLWLASRPETSEKLLRQVAERVTTSCS